MTNEKLRQVILRKIQNILIVRELNADSTDTVEYVTASKVNREEAAQWAVIAEALRPNVTQTQYGSGRPPR